jgi:hypothetical protein
MKTLEQICEEQAETIQRQRQLIAELIAGLRLATVATGEMSHRIAELSRGVRPDLQPVNGWVN